MPLTDYVCPDGVGTPINSCLTQCRLGERCLTRTTLLVISKDRQWTGVPHVTNLLNGTCEEYLKITRSYSIDPQSRAYALLGSSHHSLLEEHDNKLSELHFDDGLFQGTADLLEPDGDAYCLTDFKSYGSYKMQKILGLVKGPDKHWRRVSSQVDLGDALWQLNFYRLMLTKCFGYEINRMQLQVTVRDGGLAVAKQRGVERLMYVVPIPLMDNDVVWTFFRSKRAALLSMLENHDFMPCNDEETWGGTKCKSYCDVANHCPKGRILKGL